MSYISVLYIWCREIGHEPIGRGGHGAVWFSSYPEPKITVCFFKKKIEPNFDVRFAIFLKLKKILVRFSTWLKLFVITSSKHLFVKKHWQVMTYKCIVVMQIVIKQIILLSFCKLKNTKRQYNTHFFWISTRICGM